MCCRSNSVLRFQTQRASAATTFVICRRSSPSAPDAFRDKRDGQRSNSANFNRPDLSRSLARYTRPFGTINRQQSCQQSSSALRPETSPQATTPLLSTWNGMGLRPPNTGFRRSATSPVSSRFTPVWNVRNRNGVPTKTANVAAGNTQIHYTTAEGAPLATVALSRHNGDVESRRRLK